MHRAFLALLLAAVWPTLTAGAQDLPDTVVVLAEVQVASAGDTLLDLARQHGLGYVETVAANPGVDPWLPPEGALVVLPTTHLPPDAPRKGLVVNLGDMRLYAYIGEARSYPVGIGREAAMLIPGHTHVLGKRKDPTWVPPPSVRAEKPDLPQSVPPGPDNPMGAYSLDLARPGIRIHGTNKPDGVGRRVSHGCLRLYPEDIERLFPGVPVGTVVTVVDQPVALAWVSGELFLQVHPSPHQVDELEDRHQLTPEPLPGIEERVRKAAGDEVGRIDWRVVRYAVSSRLGVPVKITADAAVAATGPPMRLSP